MCIGSGKLSVTSNVEGELKSVAPKIFSLGNFEDNNFCFVAENEVLCRANNFTTAVELLMSFFYKRYNLSERDCLHPQVCAEIHNEN
ncbi:unnamed protein product [Larinioides sclopetarius]|uniref:Uncharacterized protein n=1 Tax=Larinioides sclopetarius TaxID=280406 RepID=A0AAV2AHG7_9ARAC